MFRELLSTEFAPYRNLSPEQLDKLEGHYSLLVRWNERMNLTRITDLGDIVRLHFCESLFLACQLPGIPLKIVDVGSGAGFPGIPLAILRPDCTVDLAESNQRKCVFLREASRDVGNVRVLSRRAETIEPAYDWVVSRAVRPLEVLAMNLAPSAALLVSENDVNSLPGTALSLPWGKGRMLVTVSRGT